MFKSFSNIYNLIIKYTVVSFGIGFALLCCALVYFFFTNLLWYIPFVLFAIIVTIIVGAYLYVVLAIPFKLPVEFDAIKNKVALGKYISVSEFQSDVADFLIRFFNFFGANVIEGKFHFLDSKPLIISSGVDFDALSEDVLKKNKIWLKANKRAFYIPIGLGKVELGYMILITKGYTLPVFYSVLKDFENYYLDDQLMHFVK